MTFLKPFYSKLFLLNSENFILLFINLPSNPLVIFGAMHHLKEKRKHTYNLPKTTHIII